MRPRRADPARNLLFNSTVDVSFLLTRNLTMKTTRKVLRMTYSLRCFLPALFAVGFFIDASSAPAANPARQERMNAKFQTMIDQDDTKPPQAGAIFFVGSSIFAQWASLPASLGNIPVHNRAVGGSTTADQKAWQEGVVLRHKPTVVVYYCGSNDLKRGVSAEEAYQNFLAFGKRLGELLPDTCLIVAASIKSPDRREIWDRVEDFNKRLAAWCAEAPNARFVDINPAFFDAGGEPVEALFQPDRLHLLPTAYEAMGALLLPVVEEQANHSKTSRTD